MMTSAKRSISRARLPAIHRATRGHAAVEAVTDTRNWSLSCVLFRTALGPQDGNGVVGCNKKTASSQIIVGSASWKLHRGTVSPPRFLCEFVKLACCLQQIGRRTHGERSVEKKLIRTLF